MHLIARSQTAARSFRWVTVWLSAGAVIALLLLANSIRDYLFVTYLLATQQVRRQMSQHVAALEQQLRRTWKPGDSRLKFLTDDLDRFERQSRVDRFSKSRWQRAGALRLH